MARTYTTHMEHGADVRVSADGSTIADIRICTPDTSIYLTYAEAEALGTDLLNLVSEAADSGEVAA